MARNISELHPRLQEAVKKLQKKFPDIGIGECFRSAAEQDALYAQGRTKPGKKITNAKGSTYSSQHQWGIAVDVFYNVKGKEYSDAGYFRKIAAYAKSIGLAWGGDWKSPVDMPHLYLPDWGSTTGRLKSQYGNFENFKKTWESSGNRPPLTSTAGTGGKYMFECPTIGKGSREGNAVLLLQEILKARGIYTGKLDSDFGSATESSVKEYQKRRGLGADGIVGPKTWRDLIAL